MMNFDYIAKEFVYLVVYLPTAVLLALVFIFLRFMNSRRGWKTDPAGPNAHKEKTYFVIALLFIVSLVLGILLYLWHTASPPVIIP